MNLDELRETYAENELDHDRTPTESGFEEWLARRQDDQPHEVVEKIGEHREAGKVVSEHPTAEAARLDAATRRRAVRKGDTRYYEVRPA